MKRVRELADIQREQWEAWERFTACTKEGLLLKIDVYVEGLNETATHKAHIKARLQKELAARTPVVTWQREEESFPFLDMLPEMRGEVRGHLSVRERLRLKQCCKLLDREDAAFGLPPEWPRHFVTEKGTRKPGALIEQRTPTGRMLAPLLVSPAFKDLVYLYTRTHEHNLFRLRERWQDHVFRGDESRVELQVHRESYVLSAGHCTWLVPHNSRGYVTTISAETSETYPRFKSNKTSAKRREEMQRALDQWLVDARAHGGQRFELHKTFDFGKQGEEDRSDHERARFLASMLVALQKEAAEWDARQVVKEKGGYSIYDFFIPIGDIYVVIKEGLVGPFEELEPLLDAYEFKALAEAAHVQWRLLLLDEVRAVKKRKRELDDALDAVTYSPVFVKKFRADAPPRMPDFFNE